MPRVKQSPHVDSPVELGEGKKIIVTIKPVANTAPNNPSKSRVFENARVGIGSFFLPSGAPYRANLTADEIQWFEEKLGVRMDNMFFHEFTVWLTDKPKVLDLSVPDDLFTYKWLKSHPYVAATKADIGPSTMYYMHDEYEEAKIQNTKFQWKIKAFAYLEKMTQDERAEFIRLFGYKNSQHMLPEVVTNKLVEEAERNPQRFVETYQDNNKDLKIFIIDLVAKGILTKKGAAYYYGEDMVGADTALTVAWLKDPKNSSILHNLKLQLAK